MSLNLTECSQDCFDCIRKYKKKHNLQQGQKFEIKCDGIPSAESRNRFLKDIPEDQRDAALAVLDPVKWAAETLDWHCLDPDGEIWKRKNPNEYHNWVKENPGASILGKSRYHRSYQACMLMCSSRSKVFRCGRQVGKTETMVVSMLYHMFTKPGIPQDSEEGFQIIVITPYQSQIDLIFTRMKELIRSSPLTQNSVLRSVKAPVYQLELGNHSKVLGFTAGTKSGGNADAVRGQHANMLVFDEGDYLDPKDMDSAMSIITNFPTASVWMSSTPTGKREKFYKTCNSRLFKEFYYPSQVNPLWDENKEALFREQLTEIGYKHEILASWGEQEEGVFQNVYVQAAMRDYEYGDYAYDPSWTYSIGVDWNDVKNGTTIVVIGFNPEENKFILVDRKTISKDGWTQLAACEKIFELNRIWRPFSIYLDKGFGSCVAPDTLIQTKEGCKTIEKILEGDYVLGHDGDFHLVEKQWKANPKESYLINPKHCLPVTVSYCHPFLIYSSTNRFKDKNISEDQLRWIEAKDIDVKKDFIAIPKRKISYKDSVIIDILDFIDQSNLDWDQKYVWNLNSYKNSPSYSGKKLAQEFNCSEIMIRRIKRKFREKTSFTFGQQKIFDRIIDKYGKEALESEYLKFPRFLDIASKEFQTIAGWYLSEGSVSTSAIEFSQDSNHYSEEFQELYDYCCQLFPSAEIYKKRGTTQCRIYLFGKIIADLFETLFGKHCDKKKIHQVFEQVKCDYLVRSFIYGDGHFSGERLFSEEFSISLTSSDLIFQLRQIFIDQGILPSLFFVPPREKNRKVQWRIDIAGNEEIVNRMSDFIRLPLYNPKRVNRRQNIELQNYFLVPIHSKEYIGIREDLLDIQVKDSNSFCGNGVLLHNTQWEVLRKASFDASIDKTRGPTHPDGKIKDILTLYDFGSKIETRDLWTKLPIKKDAKPFLVESTVRRFESSDIIFPKSDELLERQLLGYVIDRVSISGKPIYKAGDEQAGDHILDGMMLAITSFVLEVSPFGKVSFNSHIAFSGKFGEKLDPIINDGDTLIHTQTNREKFKEMRERQKPSLERSEGVGEQMDLFAPKDLPAKHTTQGSRKLWSWDGFLRDDPQPSVRSLRQAGRDARKRTGITRRTSRPRRKNI